jgi:anthranilate synthase component 1
MTKLMKKFQVKTQYRTLLADIITPVSIYLQIRDKFPFSLLLESADYHSNDNSFSYICCQPVAYFRAKNNQVTQSFPDGSNDTTTLQDVGQVTALLNNFRQCFTPENDLPFKFISNGLFGFTNYDAVRYFEDIHINAQPHAEIPDMYYAAYRYVIAIDHFKNAAYLFEHNYNNEKSELDTFEQLLFHKNIPAYPFNLVGNETSDCTDEEYIEMVNQGISHCLRGDVFQIVLSRKFEQEFSGDEFNVYRALRSINPSPYLFYFDYGSFKIFGSSPEAQLIVKNGKAVIHPIAGTFKRTGHDEYDAIAAQELLKDEKESAEHVMLVDLARNDLSRNASNVQVENFKEIQYFSHVIHLVSKVSGWLKKTENPLKMVGDTFPAGTLSGAPKHRAMQLINKYEKTPRGFYGGAIGFISFNGDFNHAIIIRSFLSRGNKLTYRAGAGIVAKSIPEKEKQEVYNKIAALKRALEMSQKIN